MSEQTKDSSQVFSPFEYDPRTGAVFGVLGAIINPGCEISRNSDIVYTSGGVLTFNMIGNDPLGLVTLDGSPDFPGTQIRPMNTGRWRFSGLITLSVGAVQTSGNTVLVTALVDNANPVPIGFANVGGQYGFITVPIDRIVKVNAGQRITLKATGVLNGGTVYFSTTNGTSWIDVRYIGG
jgi:hypothetical protein